MTRMFTKRNPFVYAYLSSVDQNKDKGIVKFHAAFDTYKNTDGNLVPKTSGAFEKEIALPYAGGRVKNPW